MAMTWIKMRTDICDDMKVEEIAEITGLDVFGVVGRLQLLWSWVGNESEDGVNVLTTDARINRRIQCDNFATALRQVGWIEGDDKAITFVNFTEHNGATAKKRSADAARMAKKRGCRESVATKATNPRPEKRREEKSNTKENAARSCLTGETPPQHDTPKSAVKRAAPVTWDADHGFTACSFRRSQWAKAYPRVDLDREMAKAHAWYLDNPSRRKRSHSRFLGNWLSNAQGDAEQDAKGGRRVVGHLNDQYTIMPDDPDDDPLARVRVQTGKGEV